MRQYKILFIAAFRPCEDAEFYKTGLENAGHSVLSVDPEKAGNPKEKIEEILRNNDIDFILYTKDELPVEVMQGFKRHTRLVQWYPDSTIPDWLPPYVRVPDIFITMSEGLVEELKKYNPKVFFLSQAFAPSFFQINEISDRDIKTYSTDVTFVGTLGSKPWYLPRRTYLQTVIKNGFQLKWWGPRLPRKLSTLPLICGALGRAYGGRFVRGEEHAKICRLSKIYLAFDAMPHIRKSMSERLYIAVGCGAFYMCRHVEGIEEVLEPGKEIVTFQSKNEMIDMIQYYLKHDEQRIEIARAGQHRVLKEHTYEVRLKQLVQIIESVFS